MRVSKLIDRVRQVQGFPSDYRVSKVMGVRTQAVSQWRSGYSYPGPLHLMELCHLAGESFATVTAEIELERAQRTGRDGDAARWTSWAHRLAAGANLIGPAALPATTESTQSPGCITSTRTRRHAARGQAFARLAAAWLDGFPGLFQHTPGQALA